MGKTIAEKIDALLEGGSIPSADKLRARIPAGLVEITRIPGLGPKRVRVLSRAPRRDLARRAARGRRGRPAGATCRASAPRPTENVIAALAADDAGRPAARFLLSQALAVGEAIVDGPAAPRHARRAGRQRPPHGRHLQGPRRGGGHRATRRRWSKAFEELLGDRRGALLGRGRRARRDPLRASRSTCAWCRRRRSATCSSTSPARASTTRRCAPTRSGAGCT